MPERAESINWFDRHVLFSQIFDALTYWIWVKSANDGKYVYANKAFCQGSGLSLEQIIGKTDFELFPDAEARHFFNRDQEVIRSKEPIIVREYTPGTHTERRLLQTTKFPLFNDNGEVVGTCGIARDIGWEEELRVFVQNSIQELEAMAGGQ